MVRGIYRCVRYGGGSGVGLGRSRAGRCRGVGLGRVIRTWWVSWYSVVCVVWVGPGVVVGVNIVSIGPGMKIIIGL